MNTRYSGVNLSLKGGNKNLFHQYSPLIKTKKVCIFPKLFPAKSTSMSLSQAFFGEQPSWLPSLKENYISEVAFLRIGSKTAEIKVQ